VAAASAAAALPVTGDLNRENPNYGI
jgi:hypothetical protein